jgi:hypothetical protein
MSERNNRTFSSSVQKSMFFPITSYHHTSEFPIMDDADYREHWLLNALDDEKDNETAAADGYERSFSPTPSEGSVTTGSLMDDDELMDDGNQQSGSPTMMHTYAQTRQSTPVKSEEVSSSLAAHAEPKNDETMDDDKEQSAASDIAEPQTEKRDDRENDTDESGTVGIPTKFDVLCGQSRICASHTGNRRFQIVLEVYASRYDQAGSKQDKMILTKEIVGCITNSGGRFLKFKDGMWQEIPAVMARDKVSHALRTKVASWKKQKEEEEQQSKPESPAAAAAAAASASTSDRGSKTKAAMKQKKTHHRVADRRRSSSSIIASACEAAASFDSNDSSNSIMDGLLKRQQRIFASLTQSEHSIKSDDSHPLQK